ncbi:hypothetical protein PESHB4_11540 [Pediococcus ethanolidurans]
MNIFPKQNCCKHPLLTTRFRALSFKKSLIISQLLGIILLYSIALIYLNPQMVHEKLSRTDNDTAKILNED